MKIRTVEDLKKYLILKEFSPEIFAKEAKISGMTVRRWLLRPTAQPIPEKYHATLNLVTENRQPDAVPFDMHSVLEQSGTSFEGLISELEESGKKCQDLEQLEKDTKAKFKDKNIGKELRSQVNLVLKSIVSKKLPLKYKAICIGAVLYFINPFDLIPDAIPVVGYLDDFAVLTLVVGILGKYARDSASETPK